PPDVYFDRKRGQWVARYADGTMIGHDGTSWSTDALVDLNSTVTITGTRYTQSESEYFDRLTGGGGGLPPDLAGRIIARQQARNRAIANPANFAADVRLAVERGTSMDSLLASRAAALPRELRGAETMIDAGGPPEGNFRKNYYFEQGRASREYDQFIAD